MASTAVSLGSAELLSSTSGASLKLHSYAHFAPSEEDAELASERLTNAALTSSAENKIWIVKGNEYGLVVKLTFDDEVGQAFQDECMRAAAATLQDIRFWAGSLLQVTAIRQRHDHDGSSLIELRFAYLTGDGNTTQPRVHKLASGVPASDVHVPGGIRTVVCHSVCLDMRIASSIRSGRPISIQNSCDRQSLLTSDTQPMSSFANAEQADEDLLDCLPTGSVASELEQNPQHASGASRRSKTECTRRAPIIDRQSCGMERSYSADDCEQRAARFLPISEFLDLFAAAFQLAICSRARRGSRNITITSVESLRHLSDIMPSFWSLDYLADMSSRALLLPTISHALSNVSVVNPQSHQLRFKLDELLRRNNTKASQVSHEQSKQLNLAQGCLSTCVWSLMQHRLCDRIAIVRFGHERFQGDAEGAPDPEISYDSELDGYEIDSHDSAIKYRQPEPSHQNKPNHNHDTTIIPDLDEAMEPSSACVACIERGNGMVEEEMLSLRGTVDSTTDPKLEMDLDTMLPRSDTMLGTVNVGTQKNSEKDCWQQTDLGEMLPI
ncbi:hypothetical protein DOTSEDRAFT_80191 [Dothistroma septosporum NZE10]|uniref:Uncharacterized protein n=1 Tax=Dothistroma septosporum (strain NZE10 / CBS 128990) TaxID=675120 RepID=N1PQ31_DOTSN|nr:hypothetical protein DOTSEDRAFT_80191 [Dothistroma septosporum NZE10]